MQKQDLKKLTDYLWEIPKTYRAAMKVPARIYASEKLLEKILTDKSLEQAANMATLPRVVDYALAMPDIHQGYGFPIGGVVAVEEEGGIVSPGGIGFDINCGMRLLALPHTRKELSPHLARIADGIFARVPAGVGKGGRLRVTGRDLDAVLEQGAEWMVAHGYGEERDLAFLEEGGRMQADPVTVSDTAKKRGRDQLGTLGSGNHFLEIQEVADVRDEEAARAFGLFAGQVVVMIHSGSRGLGHQTCTDYLRILNRKLGEWNIALPDRELIYAPLTSREAQNYLAAMAAAANFAWANRTMMAHLVREVFQEVLGGTTLDPSLRTVYDVSHNMAKREEYWRDGNKVRVLVHRKGATRAFPAGHPQVPHAYRNVGHPVLIPGSMGTSSYVLVGTQEALTLSFGTSCHGAGRVLSRHAAIRMVDGRTLKDTLEREGILIRSTSLRGLAEEAPLAYKDIDEVVRVVENAGLARVVTRHKPLAVIKGD